MINKDGKKVTTKPWQTKRWREMRKRTIGDSCTQCGSEKKPLVIQHLNHPPKFSSIARKVRNKYLKKKLMLKKYRSKINKIELTKMERKACPKCDSLNVDFAKKRGDKKGIKRHVCRKCGHDNFIFIIILIPYDRDSQKLLTTINNQILDDYQGKILDEANEINQKFNNHYMSGKGATTFCKKCAYLWDIHKKKLCKICKSKYHSFSYETYWDCKKPLRKDQPYYNELETRI
ncbi:MAG: hypothetical protein HeimC2_00500 [Candidatus Heimdallarchaeota archaeon LC_2]|nr:MAG: hypothetical protein HeimC2_00500 [Candidatus Heimdallarchaeota archaeon LC_2]